MANIALNGNMTANNYIAPFAASRAVNGTMTAASRWVGEIGSNDPAFIMLTLNGNAFVNRWVVRHMPVVAGWPAPQYSMSDFALQGSLDGTTWYTLDSVSNNTLSITDRTFNAVYYRFYRVNVTKGLNCNNKIASIMEFELYEAPPTSPYLSALTISSGTLSPSFAKNTYTYTASVGYDVNSITVTPTAEVPTYQGFNATITVNGAVVTSGTASAAIPLTVGTNTITVNVRSAIGGVIQVYTLTVARADSNYLTSLSLANGTAPINMSPNFSKTVNQYTASIGTDVTGVMVTAVKEGSSAILYVNGNSATSAVPYGPITMNVGLNNITVADVVGATTNTYNIAVTKTVDVDLSALQAATTGSVPIVLTPAFDKNTLSYSGSTAKATKIKVTATADDPANVTLTINGTAATSGVAAYVSVTAGTTNAIPICVKSKSSSDTKTYTCNITLPQ